MADPTPRPQQAEPASLAERRARKVEPAEITALSERVEAAEAELGGLRARLAIHEARDARIADVLVDAADATRLAREVLDREIAARHAAEAALGAERLGREAAERAIHAERTAREAAEVALATERLRPAARAHAPAAPIPVPDGGFPAVRAVPAPAAQDAETDELLAGLARAAERLRAQAPEPVPAPVGAVPAALPPAPQFEIVDARPVRGGGLIGALERALRGRA